MKLDFITVLLLAFSAGCYAQGTDGTPIELGDDTSLMIEDNEEGEASFENLSNFLSHPINLNRCTKEELRILQILSDQQIANLFTHIAAFGPLISLYELQTIDGFDVDVIRSLMRYTTVKEPSQTFDNNFLQRVKTQGEHYLLFRYEQTIQRKKGFTDEAYNNQRFLGSRPKLSFRCRSSRPGDFSFGITAEKDEGENLQWKPTQNHYGFDYLSFHAQVINKGKIKNLIVGDYQCQFGQGLVWGGAASFGKGAESITNVRRSNIGYVPYTSAYELGNLRGLATTVKISSSIDVNASYSFANRDGSVFSNENGYVVSALQYTGLHRNSYELSRRKTVDEQVAGMAVRYTKSNLETGITMQYFRLSAPLLAKSYVYNQFDFHGKENLNGSIYANYNFNNISVFAEAAQSLSHGHAWVVGGLFSLSKYLDLSFLHRTYDRNYYSFYSSPLSESTRAQNEKGNYWGWKYKIIRRVTLSGYVDLFEFPWLKFRMYAPSKGKEWLVRLLWQPTRSTSLYFQMRNENKIRNLPLADNQVYQVGNANKYNYWINADYNVSANVRMKSRIQFSDFHFNKKTTHGFLMMQDFIVQWKNLKCTTRYAIFDSEDFDNRQYAYENDVWLAFSIPAYYGKGTRGYIMLQYKLNRHVTCWLRYSSTTYSDRNTIGSEVDMIKGNTRNDVKFETRIKF
jgi:hypothetical protein